METPFAVPLIHRAMAGSDAPIRIVGGSRQTAAMNARSSAPGMPCARAGHVDAGGQREIEVHQDGAQRDPQFDVAVQAQRMLLLRHAQARQTAGCRCTGHP